MTDFAHEFNIVSDRGELWLNVRVPNDYQDATWLNKMFEGIILSVKNKDGSDKEGTTRKLFAVPVDVSAPPRDVNEA